MKLASSKSIKSLFEFEIATTREYSFLYAPTNFDTKMKFLFLNMNLSQETVKSSISVT